jgi:hypothetical protein
MMMGLGGFDFTTTRGIMYGLERISSVIIPMALALQAGHHYF